MDAEMVADALRKVLDTTRDSLQRYRDLRKKGFVQGLEDKEQVVGLEHKVNRLLQLIAELEGREE